MSDGRDYLAGTASVPLASGTEICADAGRMPAVPARSLSLPSTLRDQLVAEARAAYPRECCGLIEGVRREAEIEVIYLHPTRNRARVADRFEIDPAEHIRLLRSLRGGETEIVGCYHSHPDGAAEPSPRDRAMAAEENFVWLVYAEPDLQAFRWMGKDFRRIALIASAAPPEAVVR